MEFFLVRIFPHSDWIRRDMKYLSVFSPNAGKYRPEKTPYLDTFRTVLIHCFLEMVRNWKKPKNLDYRTNKLIQGSMDDHNINWKLLNLLDYWKDNPFASKLLFPGGCGIYMLHGDYNTRQKWTDFDCGKLFKNRIIKK